MNEETKTTTADEALANLEKSAQQKAEQEFELEQENIKGHNNYQDTEVYETFTFKLTEPELAGVAVDAAKVSSDLKDVEKEFTGVKKEYKDKISDLEAERDALFQKIENGEEREVKCTKRVDFENEIVEFHYDDDIIKERPLREEDKQLNLDVSVSDGVKVVHSGEKTLSDNLDEAFDSLEQQEKNIIDSGEEVDGDELEPVTEKMLTTNTPVTF